MDLESLFPYHDACIDPSLPPELCQAIAASLLGPHRRVQEIRAGGRSVWLKRPERLNLRWRLQKGSPERAFAAEEAGLRRFAELEIPVARVLASGSGFLVTEGVGRSLHDLLASDLTEAELCRAFAAAGAALAKCHRAGMAHGRPKIRDICWDGREARFIDLECFDPARRGARAMERDLLILLHSLVVASDAPEPLFDAVLAAWRAEAPADAVAHFAGAAARMRLLVQFAEGLRVLRPRSREVIAVAQLHRLLSPRE